MSVLANQTGAATVGDTDLGKAGAHGHRDKLVGEDTPTKVLGHEILQHERRVHLASDDHAPHDIAQHAGESRRGETAPRVPGPGGGPG